MRQPVHNENGVLLLVGTQHQEPYIAVYDNAASTYQVDGYEFKVSEVRMGVVLDGDESGLRVFKRLEPVQARPDGFVGWMGHGEVRCSGGPLDGQTVPFLQRCETPEVARMLSM